ncbi:PREDICTED: N-acetylglucosaminyl-phosphatidylinositol de-N-acetylase [Atta cephalotes]|uniref:N-acetylglucosaminylphosphatidylinositol deacetylase n=2 Tax=Atta TaxID=12956 RepID=A0A158NZP9_ATTCE|nr:PREDICTED: N-acetylglucosaminyl-phosphatidylinositol de-N-acetylase [Atta cephalotes]XP_018047070.1 PREDICTED: N-acetylglucosaminyl-phosphatidylinositol de-N-acetylase [Atta colombica]KYM83945.1 N-acetylglucosaminyl-phosphatidylinositol de-N-acetylase [Atta colombica]
MMANLEYVRLYFSLQLNEAICWWCYYIREISWQLLIALLAYLCVCVFLYAILKRVGHTAWQLPGPPARLLLVTAHPDDEVMFFGPLVYWLTRSKASEIYLLCLSMGGDRRRIDELWECTKVLGIPEANVTIIMSGELPDDQGVQWPTDTVAESILQYIEMYKINAVVTFDKYGVSRHKNHISLYFAIAALCIEKKVPPYCKLYVLESVNIIRKYIQILDLPVSLLSASYWYLVTYEQKRTIKSAMAAHKSQYVWFRKLYMIFSRYTFINTLQEVSALDLELDLQFDED